MTPCSELRFSAVSGESAEDLDPDFLSDVGGDVVVAAEAAYDRVDVRRVPQPKLPHRFFVAIDGASKLQVIGHLHPDCQISHRREPDGFLTAISYQPSAVSFTANC